MSVANFPDRRSIVISAGLWKGFEVEVQPPTQAQPLRSFKIYQDAFEHAQALRRAHGWAVVDQTQPDGPEAA